MLRPNQHPWALKESGLVVTISAEGKEIYNLPRISRIDTDTRNIYPWFSVVRWSSVVKNNHGKISFSGFSGKKNDKKHKVGVKFVYTKKK